MNKVISKCPICDRPMIKGPTIDKHHFVPKSKGGVATEYVHKICHTKIHSLFTNKELEKYYYTAEKVREHYDMIKFIKWISKKDPEYKDKNKVSKRRK